MKPNTFEFKRWARWLGTFVGFPLAGVAARAVAGNIDTVGAAAVGGLAGGAVLGAVQVGIGGIDADRAGAVGSPRPRSASPSVSPSAPARSATAPTPRSLVVMGAISGAAVGLAQALSMPMRPRRPGPVGRGHSRAVGRRLVDHVAGDRRCRPPARDVRLIGRAGGERRGRRALRHPPSTRQHPASPSSAHRAIGGGVMGRLATIRGAPPARRHPRRGSCCCIVTADHRQLGVLGPVDRLRRGHHAPSRAAWPNSSTTWPRPVGRSRSSPTASTSTTLQVQRDDHRRARADRRARWCARRRRSLVDQR